MDSRRWRSTGPSRLPAAAVTSLTSCWKGTSSRLSSWIRPKTLLMKPCASGKGAIRSHVSTKNQCKSLILPLATTASCYGIASATWTMARRDCSCEKWPWCCRSNWMTMDALVPESPTSSYRTNCNRRRSPKTWWMGSGLEVGAVSKPSSRWPDWRSLNDSVPRTCIRPCCRS